MKIPTTLLSLLLAMVMATPAVADYKPKKATRPRSASSTASVRGSCVPGTHASVVAVAPRTITGMTSRKTPTLVWYNSDPQSFPMDINLYEYEYSDADLALSAEDVASKEVNLNPQPRQTKVFQKQTQKQRTAYPARKKRLKLRQELQTQLGLMQWTVPEEFQLESGKRYLWQVVVYCNPNRPSMAAVTEAELQLESVPSALQSVLAQTTDSVQRSHLYGQNGFWYEAWAEVLRVKTPEAIARRQELLQALLRVESAPLGANPTALEPEQLKIKPEVDSPLVQLAKQVTRQLQALVEEKTL